MLTKLRPFYQKAKKTACSLPSPNGPQRFNNTKHTFVLQSTNPSINQFIDQPIRPDPSDVLPVITQATHSLAVGLTDTNTWADKRKAVDHWPLSCLDLTEDRMISPEAFRLSDMAADGSETPKPPDVMVVKAGRSHNRSTPP